jgi:hypothetical protein
MLRTTWLEIGAILGLGLNYASAYVIAFVWNFPDPDSELILHIFTVFIVSLLFGALIVDIRKALLYALGAIPLGVAIATTLISAPSIMLAENIALVDTSVTVALTAIVRIFIIGVTFQIIGIFVGCLFGDSVSTKP